MCFVSRLLQVASVLLFLSSAIPAMAAPGPDGIELFAALDTSGDVALAWTGGQPTFEVFRSPFPTDVTNSVNKIGETDRQGWVDSPPPGPLFYYLVTSPCVVQPPEICDGVDNDCDGAIDEDQIPVPTECGLGVCEGNTGELVCMNGSEVDTCDPLEGASGETCDGLDNDCDGVTDEGNPDGGDSCDTGLLGVCSAGTTACEAGSLVCEPDQPPTAEVCDGLDNDCDGSLVDGFFDNDGDGIPDCSDDDDDNDGTPDTSDPCQFIADTADCLDDADLDGVADGNETAAARYNPNIGGPGTPEQCDGVDNDGDLLIDEGTGCTACD